TKEEALGLHLSDWVVDLGPEEVQARIDKAKTVGFKELLQSKCRRKDGTVFDPEVSLSTFEFDGRPYVYAATRDITRRKAAARRIEHLSQMYALLSSTNQAIVRARSEQELYDHLSRAAIGNSRFYGAMIRIADDEGILRAVAYSENMRSVAAKTLNPSNLALPESHGPVATAYRENRLVIANDLLAHDFDEPWQTALRSAAIRTTAALPIRRQNKPIGVFALNAMEVDFFDADMTTLLGDMVSDIAFAMDSIEAERQRVQTEKALTESEVKFRCLVEQSLTGICIVEGGRFTYVNPRFADIHGYAPEEMVGLRVVDVISDEDRPFVRAHFSGRLGGTATRLARTFHARRKDGSTVLVGANIAPATVEGKPIAVGMVQDISEREEARRQIEARTKQLEAALLGTLTAVATMVEMRDPYTAGHQRRVGLLARAIGAEMGLPDDVCNSLEHIGRVHDLGKISVPAEILAKPSRLSDIERTLIQNHPKAGYEILKDVDFPWPVAKAILQHHERLDGSGYPSGLKGDDIIVEARILAVADTVEAMASHRPYRPTLGIDAAIEEIVQFRGLRYDADVVDACLRLFREKGYQIPQ
ncbi:MAG: PAS domain S-box protein, partial [Acidobacteria bacterium]|nr:PAS domain S-box protein [Acidobacteriota bacterium]